MTGSTELAGVLSMDPDRVYALSNPYELNGHVSSHGSDDRGFAPFNCYLLKEGDEALLLDSGYTVHDAAIRAQLGSIVGPSTSLTFLPLRISELPSVSNARSIAENFKLDRMAGFLAPGAAWYDFRPDLRPYGTEVGDGAFEGIEPLMPHHNTTFSVDRAGLRTVEVTVPPFRLLNVYWIWDAATRTLFTADAFSHLWRDTPNGPWVVGPEDPLPSAQEVYETLVGGRYWWLPGANTAEIEESLGEIFATYDVETIAPSTGCIIQGRELVEQHVALLREALVIAREATPAAVPRRPSTTRGKHDDR